MSRTLQKAWCGTWNNYNEQQYTLLKTFGERECEYAIIGKEKGESGTNHLQFYLYLKEKKRFTWLKQNISTSPHFEPAKGSPSSNRDYCSKEKDFIEIGECPGTKGEKGAAASKKRWTEMRTLAKEGKMEELAELYPKEATLYERNFESIRLKSLHQLPHENWTDDDLKSHFWWIQGPTGSGKSHVVNEINKLIAPGTQPYKKGLNKWWNGYTRQRVIHIEEATPKAMEYLAHYFKQWADKWGFMPEVKNSFLDHVVPEFILVTSNYSIIDCFPNEDDYLPIQRRFTEFHLNSRDDQTIILEHFRQFAPGEQEETLPASQTLLADTQPDTQHDQQKPWILDPRGLGNTIPDPLGSTQKRKLPDLEMGQEINEEEISDPPPAKRARWIEETMNHFVH